MGRPYGDRVAGTSQRCRTYAEVVLEVRVLGPLAVAVDGMPVPIGSPNERKMLAAFVAGGGLASRDRLMSAVWGEALPSSALRALQTYVSRLRRSLGAARIETRPPGWMLHAEVVDSAEFERMSAAASTLSGWSAVSALDTALAWWRGSAYEEFADDPLLVAEARRLEVLRHGVRVDRAGALLAAGAHSESAAAVEAILGDDPLDERAWELLARALAADGRIADALRAVQRCHEALATVGLVPSDRLAHAERAILSGTDPSPREPSRYGLVPTLRGKELIGREETLARIVHEASPGSVITLVGPGGVGKSRLAAELGRILAPRFADGAWFCDLSTIEQAELVTASIVTSVGAPLTGPLEDRLVSFCARRQLLLVLDNCEHVVDEAARVTRRLLDGVQSLLIVATSREPLHISGERVMPIEPLSAEAAMTLYRHRAAAAGSAGGDRVVVEELCRRLDNLPLAIEIAAGWSRSLAASELLTRLDAASSLLSHAGRDAPSRHKTLRAALGWSYDLLGTDEQNLLEWMSVFAGPVDFDTALEVAGHKLPRDEAGRVLLRLVDRSLVVADHDEATTRFRLLETTRSYMADALRHRADYAVAVEEHARWAARLAGQIRAGFHSPDAPMWAERAEQSLPELQAAVYRCLDAGHHGLALEIVAGLAPIAYEWLRADISEWAHRTVQAAQRAGVDVPPDAHVCAALGPLHGGRFDEAHAAVHGVPGPFAAIVRSDVALYRGDYATCEQEAHAAAEAAKADGDATLLTLALMNVGLARGYRGEIEHALAIAADVRAAATKAGSPSALAWTDFLEGEFLADASPERALPLLERALQRARTIGSAMTEGIALVSLTTMEAQRGDPAHALSALEEAILHWHRRDDWTHQRVTLRNLVLLLERLGQDIPAATLLAGVDTELPAAGTDVDHVEAARSRLSKRLGDQFEFTTRRGETLDRQELVDLALGSIAETRPHS